MSKYAELPAFMEHNFITEADGDMLHREARALALRRIEESARTEKDFREVIKWWDKLDSNRDRLTIRKRCTNLSRMRTYQKY